MYVEVMFSISQSPYIDSFQMEIPARGVINRYIAAQGPLEKTCGDFWQVIIYTNDQVQYFMI